MLGIVERDRGQTRAPLFENLGKAGFVPEGLLDLAEESALAAWYARQQQVRAAGSSKALLPLELASAAEAVEKRMQKVLEHYFGDHPVYGPELITIAAGRGYQDLANDLQQYAELYERPDIAAVITKDPKHYRPSDLGSAHEHAAAIMRALGLTTTGEAADWALRAQRAYTRMSGLYTKVCLAGALLFHEIEDIEVTYPRSLVSVVRSAPVRTEENETPTETPSAPSSETS